MIKSKEGYILYIDPYDAKCKSPCTGDCYRKRPVNPNTGVQNWFDPNINLDGTCNNYIKDSDK